MNKHSAGDKLRTRTAKEETAPAPAVGIHVERSKFSPENLDKSVISIPLLEILKRDQEDPKKLHAVVIDLNLDYPGGVEAARRCVIEETEKAVAHIGIHKKPEQGLDLKKSGLSRQYAYARLEAKVLRELVRRDGAGGAGGKRSWARAIYHIWPDFKIHALMDKSIRTVKADAAQASFSAFGEDIVWAVMDSGIEESHLHFRQHRNLDLRLPLGHEDFTGTGSPTEDVYGHGTHVAGVIAGELDAGDLPGKKKSKIRAFRRYRKETGNRGFAPYAVKAVSGMAPKCKLLSLKVLDQDGTGDVSNVLAAIDKVQEINNQGRRLLIHGVNISLGYEFDPEWFACGQSPLCVEVDRLVRSGVVVVVCAGNSGYGWARDYQNDTIRSGLAMTIGDPGNAALAMTVGSTHRDSPHLYGVSYFSSKGPTGDGRLKPDLVAPGEKIISCAAGKLGDPYSAGGSSYIEGSGTSLSAPHVSGVIAAFLSVRPEFIGQPERVKQIFLAAAVDLGRERYFQGSGLIDLMRAIQSI